MNYNIQGLLKLISREMPLRIGHKPFGNSWSKFTISNYRTLKKVYCQGEFDQVQKLVDHYLFLVKKQEKAKTSKAQTTLQIKPDHTKKLIICLGLLAMAVITYYQFIK